MSSFTTDELVTAARGYAAAPVTELTDAELSDELLALRAAADAAEAAYLTRLAEFDHRNLAETGAAISTTAWARHHLHIAPGETRRALRTGRGLRQLPDVAAALATGRIRVPHAAAITDGATMLGYDVIGACQHDLVDAATTDDPTRLRAALRGYGAAVDNPDAIKRAERRDQDRWLDLSPSMDDTTHVAGSLGPEDAAIVRTAINALGAPTGATDRRTAAQRRADALVEVCRRHLSGHSHHTSADSTSSTGAAHPTRPTDAGAPGDAGDADATGHPGGTADDTSPTDGAEATAATGVDSPSSTSAAHSAGTPDSTGSANPAHNCACPGGSATNIVVTTDLATLEARTGGYGELPDGTILRGDTIRRLACDAGITRIITGPDSQPLDVGRTRRTATTAQRRALTIRDGGCLFPGCHRPAEWADVHHVTHWARGGHTTIDDMCFLCRKHHTTVHEGTWTIHRTRPGRFIFTSPNGNLIQPDRPEPTRTLVARLLHHTPPRAEPTEHRHHHDDAA